MRSWKFVVIVAIGVGIRLPILLADTSTVLTHWGSDDLFYFTQIASHLAAGDGLTFDGIHPTTGVQPLWLMLLVPFGRLFSGNGPLALSVVHWLVTGLTIVTGLCFPWLVRRFIPDDRLVGWLAAVIWVAHPRILGMTFEGTEGALLALVWVVVLGTWKVDGKSHRFAVVLGVVFALGCLTRIDFLAPSLFLLVLRPGRFVIRSLRQIVISGGILLLVAGTWPVICWWITGSPFPDSGVAKALHAERMAEVQLIAPGVMAEWDAFKSVVQGPRYLMTTGGRVSRVSLVLIPLAVMAFAIVGRSRERRWSVFPRTTRLAEGLWPATAAAGCLLLVYPLVLKSMRFWYVTGPLLLMTLLTAVFAIDLGSRWGGTTNSCRPLGCDRLVNGLQY